MPYPKRYSREQIPTAQGTTAARKYSPFYTPPSWRHERAHLLQRLPLAATPSPGGHDSSVPLAPHDVPLTTMPSGQQRLRSAAKRPRSTLCAVPGAAAPGTTTTEADPPRERRPRRAAAREAASVGAATSGGASLARPRRACSTPCVPPSAATSASSASRSEPLDALSLAQREASGAPRTPARPPSAPGPRARLAPPANPTFQDLG